MSEPAATSAELQYVDRVGRYFAAQYSVAPVTGRVCGWLMICEPPQPTAADVAAALGISRSAVGTAVTMLERWHVARRVRRPGERADRIEIDPAFGARSLESPAEYDELRAIVLEGLALLADGSPRRLATLRETLAFTDFLIERLPRLAAEWNERRARLVARGELPDR